MKIVIPKEKKAGERRIAITPVVAKKMIDLGFSVAIEEGLGEELHISDEAFREIGALVEKDPKQLLSSGDIVLRVRKTETEEIAHLKEGAYHISFFDAYQDKEATLAFQKQKVTAISMEMMPRSTLAQKMDALSSQANLGGYVSVILAAEKMQKVFPMMTTPAGTISPITVFVIGVGVAGLQAIATAKRLGARVLAFDTRAETEEQVRSLGARFVKVDLGETGQTKDGYAKALTKEQLELQRQEMAKVCAQSDIVITTAALVGRKAPIIITEEMVKNMKPGSVIVDMAIETGGNVEGSKLDKTVRKHGVHIIGMGNLPGKVALDASQMYAANLFNFLKHFWNAEEKRFSPSLEDSLFQACTVTSAGNITQEKIAEIHKG